MREKQIYLKTRAHKDYDWSTQRFCQFFAAGHIAKGQKFSKANYLDLNCSKKRTKYLPNSAVSSKAFYRAELWKYISNLWRIWKQVNLLFRFSDLEQFLNGIFNFGSLCSNGRLRIPSARNYPSSPITLNPLSLSPVQVEKPISPW